MPLHIETPLIESRPLSEAAGCTVMLKLEALQPPGSFKIRGIGAACEHHAAQGKKRFISSSGGNAGIAVAYAGRRLGVPVTVVVPETTTAHARQLIQQEGAALVVHGAAWHEAHAHALSLMDADAAFLHPFDDALIWAGHATMIDEAARQTEKPDAVILSVGGGGLFSGVIEGMRRNGWGDVPVIAAETQGAHSLFEAICAGEHVALDAVTSIATSLGAKQVCAQAYALTQAHTVRGVVVSDAAALKACERFMDDHRLVVEPACGASLALAYERVPQLAGLGRVLVIVCGGATATVDQLRLWHAGMAAQTAPAPAPVAPLDESDGG